MTRLVVAVVGAAVLIAAPLPRLTVLHREGLVHGFLVLDTLDGTEIANGDLLQTARGDEVTSRLVFHFKDGSLQDETAEFSERGEFRLRRDHLVQKGPSFPQAIDLTVDAVSGRATARYSDDHGASKVESADISHPPAPIGNGMLLVVLKNVRAGAAPPKLALVVATPKPRIVTLDIQATGRTPFTTGSERREAIDYTVKTELGGITGLVAPLVGKQPPDAHVWILPGDAPAFVKSEQPFFANGPLWRLSLASVRFPSGS